MFTELEKRFMERVPSTLKDMAESLKTIAENISPTNVMVLYEVDEEDNTKTSIVAMLESDWQHRKPDTVEKILREYFDERYSGCDDEFFCYDDEIKQAVESLTTGYVAKFAGDSVFWDEVKLKLVK